MDWPLAFFGSVVILCFTVVWLQRMATEAQFRAVAAYNAYKLQQAMNARMLDTMPKVEGPRREDQV